MNKYIIFDLDGTLLQPHKIDIYEVLLKQISELEPQKLDEARFLIQTNYSIRAKKLLELLQFSQKDIDCIMNKIYTIVDELKASWSFFPDVVDIIEEVSKNYTLILSTVSSDDYANYILEKWWIKSRFDLILWSTYIPKWDEHIKKMKDYFWYNNFEQKSIYIWDSEKDELIAKSNWIKFIKVVNWVNLDTLKLLTNW